MVNQAADIILARREGVDLEDFARALDRAIADGYALPAWSLGMDRTPPAMAVHKCAICRKQVMTEAGLIPAAWSAPNGYLGPLFCPECDPGPLSAIRPGGVACETGEGAAA